MIGFINAVLVLYSRARQLLDLGRILYKAALWLRKFFFTGFAHESATDVEPARKKVSKPYVFTPEQQRAREFMRSFRAAHPPLCTYTHRGRRVCVSPWDQHRVDLAA